MNRSCITQRGLVLLLVVSTFGPVLHAGFKAEQNVIVQSDANVPQSVCTADLDGDGDLDVLAAFSKDSMIGWYANDGSGRFGPQQVITTAAGGTLSVCTADLDADGDLDVLSASASDNEIAWYANDGSGHFGSKRVIATEVPGAKSVCAADLDGDGDLDVLSASYKYYFDGVWHLESSIVWYPSDGTGQFGTQHVIMTETEGYRAQSVYVADLDGDGDLDVLSAFLINSSDGKIAWYANDGTGQFGPQQVITTAAHWVTCVHASDLDGDGDLDVLSASGNDKIAWYANDGTGQFDPQQVLTTGAFYIIYPTATDGVNWVYAVDLDGDEDLDVLAASYVRGPSTVDERIAWYANDGSGHFGSQQVITTAAKGARSVCAADLDGDGDLDVMSASYDNDPQAPIGKIAWYANDGVGEFGSQHAITTAADGARCVYAADLDGDGDLDVLSASWEDDKIAWYANDGSGHFGSQQVIGREADGATSIYAADLDGDGDLDVLSASYWDGKIAWYANDGSGYFGPQQVITVEAPGANCVYAADLDGDADVDVLSASSDLSGPGKIAWYANDGSGHFGRQEVITTGTDGGESVYAADLDGDGDIDVLSASYTHKTDRPTNSKIAWYVNDGTGHFASQQVISTAVRGPKCVYGADLDADGDLDVLSASSADDKIAWYANDGTGQFGPQQVTTNAADGAHSVYAADLDGDGNLDVLSASYLDDEIAWYANDGTGQFGPQQVTTTAAIGADCVYAADLDGDGDLDVLSASSGDDKIAWYENE